MLGKVGINHQVSFKAQHNQDLSNCFASPKAINKAKQNLQTQQQIQQGRETRERLGVDLQPRDWHERGASAQNLQELESESPLTNETSHIAPHDRPQLNAQQLQERQKAAENREFMGHYAPRSGRPATEQVKLSDDQVSFLNTIKDPKLRGQTRQQLIQATQKQQRQAARDAIRPQVANMDIGQVAGVYHEKGKYPVSDGSEVPVQQSYLEHDDSRSVKGNQGYMPGVMPGQLSEEDKLNAEMAQGLAFPRRAKSEPKVEPPTVKIDPSRYDTGYGKDYMPL